MENVSLNILEFFVPKRVRTPKYRKTDLHFFLPSYVIHPAFYVMFKKRAAVVYRSIKTRGGFKNIPQKACLLGVQTKVQIVRGR